MQVPVKQNLFTKLQVNAGLPPSYLLYVYVYFQTFGLMQLFLVKKEIDNLTFYNVIHPLGKVHGHDLRLLYCGALIHVPADTCCQ